MNDGRGSGVQKVKAFEDLSAPGTQDLDFHHLETLQVAAGQRNGTEDGVSVNKGRLSVQNYAESSRFNPIAALQQPCILFKWPLV